VKNSTFDQLASGGRNKQCSKGLRFYPARREYCCTRLSRGLQRRSGGEGAQGARFFHYHGRDPSTVFAETAGSDLRPAFPVEHVIFFIDAHLGK
jgi:hypothetical protein